MAPSTITEAKPTGTLGLKAVEAPTIDTTSNAAIHFLKGHDEINEDGVLVVGKKDRDEAKHPDWLPTWDPNHKLDPFPEDFNENFQDRGFFADPELKNLFPPEKKQQIKLTNLSPKLGTEVRGVQLSQLSDKGKDDLALYVAQRGVVVFRDQDLKDKGLEFNKKFGEYFGPLHIHPSSGAPLNYPEFHIVYRRKDPEEYSTAFKSHLTQTGWHSDITFEKNTPGTTFFAILEGPDSGGDTVFADTEEAYNRLSPRFKEMIKGLKTVHSSVHQAKQSRASGGIERKPPTTSIHPLVRIHPVTKKKALFSSNGFIQGIDGLKKEESDAILGLLREFVNSAIDLQVRARWEPGSVVVWDNRRVLHSATFDFDDGSIRHCYRITPQAERPVENEEELRFR